MFLFNYMTPKVPKKVLSKAASQIHVIEDISLGSFKMITLNMNL